MRFKRLSLAAKNDTATTIAENNADHIDMKKNELYGQQLTNDTITTPNDYKSCGPIYEEV